VGKKSFHRSTFVSHLPSGETALFKTNRLISTAGKFFIMKGFYAYMPVITDNSIYWINSEKSSWSDKQRKTEY
jgi:hypothetical protein